MLKCALRNNAAITYLNPLCQDIHPVYHRGNNQVFFINFNSRFTQKLHSEEDPAAPADQRSWHTSLCWERCCSQPTPFIISSQAHTARIPQITAQLRAEPEPSGNSWLLYFTSATVMGRKTCFVKSTADQRTVATFPSH